MLDALYIGATGMHAQQTNVETIANNLANVNTTGFKKARVNFSDLVARQALNVSAAGADFEAGPLTQGLRSGAGVGIAGVSRLFDIGDMKKTESPFDIAIQGEGFLEVLMPDGSSAYTRGGTLKVNQDRQLATLTGLPFKPGITVPDGANELAIDANGTVLARVSGQADFQEIGKLELVRFANPQGLEATGDGIFRNSTVSGDAILVPFGSEQESKFAQGYLEGSNVKMVDEMINLMVAQRTYEANTKVVQAADEMLGMINALRR